MDNSSDEDGEDDEEDVIFYSFKGKYVTK